MVLSGEGVGGVENFGMDVVVWLRENLFLYLEKDGVDVDLSKRIVEVCVDVCVRILVMGWFFDLMMIMDVMEEEVEWCDLCGDDIFLFEIGRKVVKVLI